WSPSGRPKPPLDCCGMWTGSGRWLCSIQLAMDGAQRPHLLCGVVGRAHQRPALHPLEAELHTEFLQLCELFQSVVAVHRQVLLAWLEILADGEDVHAPTALVAHHGLDFIH